MARQTLRSMTRLIGFIDDGPGGDKVAYDDTMHKLGEYIKSSNQTRTVHGHIIGYGDLTAVLIWNKEDFRNY